MLTVKGADENIADLNGRVREIELEGRTARGIETIVHNEAASTMAYSLTDGTIYGPFRLPMTMFQPRNDWQAEAPYIVRDYVTVETGSYVCTASHTAGTSFNDDRLAGRWQLIASRGPAGKDFSQYVGFYDPTLNYSEGDLVIKDAVDFILFRALFDVPFGAFPGTFTAPGAPTYGAPYWTQMSTAFGSATDEFAFSTTGTPAASAIVGRRRSARFAAFRGGLTGGVARADVAASASTVFSVKVNGTQVGTFTFAAGSQVATFTGGTGGAMTIQAGDSLTVTAPATPDATLAGLDVAIPYIVYG